MPLRRKPGAAQAGFTLIEVLIAVAVLGMLVLSLGYGVRTGLALRHKQIERVAATADLDSAMRLLRRLLHHIPVPPEGDRAQTEAEGPPFRGEPDRVSFIADLPTGLGQSRRADMTLFVRDRSLILAWSPRRHERLFGPRPAPAEVELLRGIAQLELAYRGQPSPDQPPGWQSRWKEPAPPELVRVRLLFPERDRRRWPDLIVESGL
jgi:general secretion pathway protein J